MQKLLIYANYISNKNYYAQELCVNKDEPESCCEGKCELKKELDAMDSQSGDAATTGNHEKDSKIQKYEKAEEFFTGTGEVIFNSGEGVNIYTVCSYTTCKGFLLKVLLPPRLVG